ncbi:DUF6520 family protein [Chryseobacterium kwangjuense]|uniref:DUF333 domain-containing protein n=1 Tax=Chryseobacterium kwangjuense TaxID=267125 RepID=A0A135WJ35_9FLAO|nr:DUF6520 family protein [Chryseobacterium kwangjuense]KXH84911.1 hypothetical protein AU378_03910 [Chryseobacterium kwangjuense]
MKKILLPALIVAMGAGAAFASNMASKTAKVIPTYRIDANNKCVQVQQDCNSPVGFVCTWNGDGASQLYQFMDSETECSQELYRTTP